MDADRKKVTWEHLYKHIYNEKDWTFWGLLDFDANDDGTIGWKSEINWNSENKPFKKFVDNFPNFKITGDADFGMKDNQCNEYIKNAKEKMHMFYNFSLMPQTGGMNNKKGAFGHYDRFDEFIYYLSNYYKIIDENERYEYAKIYLWHNSRKKEITLKTLCDFLNLFKDIYDYLRKIYFIDNERYTIDGNIIVENFVKDLVDAGEKTAQEVSKKKAVTGKKKIKGVIYIEKYCELAKTYWEIRRNKMQSVIPEKEYNEYFNKDISINKYL